MELTQAIEKRSSVRNFKSEAAPVDALREAVKRGGQAPSINNSQPWKFIAVVNKEKLQKMGEAVTKKLHSLFEDEAEKKATLEQVNKFSTFFVEAPAVIAVATKPYEAVIDKILEKRSLSHDDVNVMRNHPDIQSVGAAVQNILLSLVDQGYDGCWLTGLLVARKEIEEILGIKEPYSLAACVAVGKAQGEPKQKSKKPIDEIFSLID